MVIKRTSALVALAFIVLVVFSLYPETPCACVTPKMVGDRIFRMDVSNATKEELFDSFSKVVSDFRDEEGPMRLMLVSGGVCDFVRNNRCKLVLKKSMLFEEYIILTLEKDKDGKIAGFSVSRS